MSSFQPSCQRYERYACLGRIGTSGEPSTRLALKSINRLLLSAVSRSWGKHYLRSLSRAHRSQLCNNFKVAQPVLKFLQILVVHRKYESCLTCGCNLERILVYSIMVAIFSMRQREADVLGALRAYAGSRCCGRDLLEDPSSQPHCLGQRQCLGSRFLEAFCGPQSNWLEVFVNMGRASTSMRGMQEFGCPR